MSYLREKELLLVLDNLEHLLESSAFLAQVLRRAPGVVLLVTSRERLNLYEEWVYEIRGLTYPENGTTPYQEQALRIYRELGDRWGVEFPHN